VIRRGEFGREGAQLEKRKGEGHHNHYRGCLSIPLYLLAKSRFSKEKMWRLEQLKSLPRQKGN